MVAAVGNTEDTRLSSHSTRVVISATRARPTKLAGEHAGATAAVCGPLASSRRGRPAGSCAG